MNVNDRKTLLNKIDAVSFAIDDVKLYLDTHPCDEQALMYYDAHKKLRHQYVEEYTKCFGPLTADNVDTCNYWTWVNKPWPWERGWKAENIRNIKETLTSGLLYHTIKRDSALQMAVISRL